MPQKPVPAYTLDEILPAKSRDSMSHLEILAQRVVQGFTQGLHRSKRLGVSTEFDHHKNYQPGDPLRHLDWKASARHDRYYVKRYVEDSALTVRLVVDHSGSMAYATDDGPTKYFQAARLAGCLAYLITSHGDSAALTLVAGGQTVWLPAGSTRRHLVRVLDTLAAREAADRDDLAACLHQLLKRNERRGIVALISDMMYDPAPVQRELAALVAQGHEVVLFRLRDPTEEDFPFNRWVQFGDLENASVKHRVDAVTLRRLYEEEYRRLGNQWSEWSRHQRVHLVTTRTDQNMELVLSEYIAFRNGN
jgi:uncharacterized protein (DUF58 family)